MSKPIACAPLVGEACCSPVCETEPKDLIMNDR
jgi:hypothetical protein